MAEKLVPALRFRGFDGEWEEKKVSDVADIVGGGTPSTAISSYWGGDIHWYAPAEMEDKIFAFDSERKITENGLKHSSAKILPVDKTILFTSRAGIGKMAILKHEAATNQGFQSLVLHDGYDPYFVYSYGFDIKKKAESIASGSTFLEVSGKMVGGLILSFPDNSEQQKIGKFMADLDKLIAGQKQSIEKLKNLKKALLEKLFPGKGEKIPSLRFRGFDGEWEEKKVDDVFNVTRGYVLSVTKTKKEKNDVYVYPVYSSQTLNDGLMGYYDKYLYSDAITWTTDGANAGTVKFRKGKFYCTNVCGVLISDEGYANYAVSEILNNVAWKYVSKVGNPKLMNNVMSEICFIVTSKIDEQEKISEVIEKINKLIKLQSDKLAKLQNMKQACLRKMFV